MQKHPSGDLDRKAGLGSRFLALLLDGIIIGIPLVIIFAILTTVVLAGASQAGGAAGGGALAAVGILQILAPLVGFGYWIVMEAVWGYTIGKKIMGIVVVNEDGSAIGWAESLIRNLLRIVDTLPTLYLVGAIAILITDDEQRVGDIAASTLVVEQA